MARTVKFLLGAIAVGLLWLDLQLAGVPLVGEAQADIYGSDIVVLSKSLDGIAEAIRASGGK